MCELIGKTKDFELMTWAIGSVIPQCAAAQFFQSVFKSAIAWFVADPGREGWANEGIGEESKEYLLGHGVKIGNSLAFGSLSGAISPLARSRESPIASGQAGIVRLWLTSGNGVTE